ncbi:hypothetical protein FB451DRAFT_1480898 [Mycena latifolia]|nr:hypothetical protein FB451DRAFT_1480898 [Mycena latifolia]
MVLVRPSTPPALTAPRRADADTEGNIDLAAFRQILDLDDDGTHYACSKDMIAVYFAQAPAAFKGMDSALAATDLRALADLAHFLMGSSATLGMPAADTAALAQLGALLAEVRREYADAETWLRRWYAEHGEAFPEAAQLQPKVLLPLVDVTAAEADRTPDAERSPPEFGDATLLSVPSASAP